MENAFKNILHSYILICLLFIPGCAYHNQEAFKSSKTIHYNKEIHKLSSKTLVINKTIKVERIISVYDGDTFKCDLKDSDNYPSIFGKSILVRINGIDCPEIKGDEKNHELAEKSKEFSSNIFLNGKIIELRNPQRDKYFRILADVYIDNISLAEKLKAVGLAKEYHGESKNGIW